MPLNNAELSIVLREVIDPEIVDQVERTPTLYNLIPKGGDINARQDGSGNNTGVFMYAKTTPNPSLAWFNEGGVYPAGSNSKRVKFSAGFSRVAITSRLTRDVLEGADKQAIVNVVTEEIVDDTKSVLKEISQQLYGNGTGSKGTITGVSVTGTGTTNDPYVSTLTIAGGVGTAQLIVGGKYDIVSGSAGDRDGANGTQSVAVNSVVASNSGLTLTSKTATTAVFSGVDVQSGLDVLASDYLVYAGSAGNICIKGLDYHLDSGTGDYQGISRNTYPSFKAYTLASAGALTVAMLYKVIFQARYARRNDLLEGDYVILSAPTQTHAYALLGDVSSALYGNNEYKTALSAMPNNGTLDYGFRNFKFAGLTWIEDIDCPPDRLFIINFNKFRIHEFKPLSKVFEGNGFMPVPAFDNAGVGSFTDNVLYTMTWKGQMVSKDPQMAGVKITGLSTSNLARPQVNFDFS